MSKVARPCQKWHGRAKMLHLDLLKARGLAREPYFLPYFCASSRIIAWFVGAKGHDRANSGDVWGYLNPFLLHL